MSMRRWLVLHVYLWFASFSVYMLPLYHLWRSSSRFPFILSPLPIVNVHIPPRLQIASPVPLVPDQPLAQYTITSSRSSCILLVC